MTWTGETAGSPRKQGFLDYQILTLFHSIYGYRHTHDTKPVALFVIRLWANATIFTTSLIIDMPFWTRSIQPDMKEDVKNRLCYKIEILYKLILIINNQHDHTKTSA